MPFSHGLAVEFGISRIEREDKFAILNRHFALFQRADHATAQPLTKAHGQPPAGGLFQFILAAQADQLIDRPDATAEIGEQGLGQFATPIAFNSDPIAM